MFDFTPTTTHPIWAIEKKVWRAGIVALNQKLQHTSQLCSPLDPIDKMKSQVRVKTCTSKNEAIFKNPHMICTPATIHLSYHANSHTEATYCSSIYVKNGQDWQLVHHDRKSVTA